MKKPEFTRTESVELEMDDIPVSVPPGSRRWAFEQTPENRLRMFPRHTHPHTSNHNDPERIEAARKKRERRGIRNVINRKGFHRS